VTRMLVTGASGFIGRAVVAAFAARGVLVRAGMRHAPQRALPAGAEAVQYPDLERRFDWRPYLEGIDQVVHLAGIAHSRAAPALYERINREATVELATAAAAAGVKHFVFVSSIRAQGGPSVDHTLSERDTPAPTDAYGRSKLAAEDAVRAAGVPFTILRPVVLYGPGVKGNFALLLAAARSPWPLPVKDFVGRRSLLGIDNFVSALGFVLASPAANGETYIVADPGMPPRLPDVIATLREAAGRSPMLLPFPPNYLEALLRLAGRGEVWERLGASLQADPGKLLAAGWQPAHDTRSGLIALAQAETRDRSTMPPRTPTPKT